MNNRREDNAYQTPRKPSPDSVASGETPKVPLHLYGLLFWIIGFGMTQFVKSGMLGGDELMARGFLITAGSAQLLGCGILVFCGVRAVYRQLSAKRRR